MDYRYNPIHEKRKEALFERLRKHLAQEDDYIWELLGDLEEIDPTPNGKYITWLVREYLRGKITLPEDGYHLNQVLIKFHRFKHLLENRDIFSYTKGKLSVAVGEFDLPDGTNAEARLRAKLEGRKILYGAKAHNGRLFRVVHLTTSLATREAARGTDWCISSLEVGQNYLSRGMLLLIEEFEEEKWKSLILSHVGYQTRRGNHEESPDYIVATAEMMDIENRPMKRDEEYDFDVISDLLHLAYTPFLRSKIRIFGSAWDREYWEKHLDEATDHCADDYWSYQDFSRSGCIEDNHEYCTRLLVYSQAVLQRSDSWIEERLLRNNFYGDILSEYAQTVIQGPWFEAEPLIATNSMVMSDYLLYLFRINNSDVDKLREIAQRLLVQSPRSPSDKAMLARGLDLRLRLEDF